MALPLVEQDVSAFLGETIVIETPVDLTGTGLTDLDGFTAAYAGAQQGAAVPDTLTASGVIGDPVAMVVTITTTIGSSEAVAATYAHQLSVTDGVNTYIVMTGQLSVRDALADDPHYFTIAECRATDAAFDETTYLDSTIAIVRDQVETAIETAWHVAFVPRSVTAEKVSGTGTKKLFLGNFAVRAVSAVTVDGTALTAGELAELVVHDNVLYRESGWPTGYYNIAVTYTHGYDAPPAPVKRAALILAKEWLVPSQIPANATSQSYGDMTYRIMVAGRDGVFGIPAVDSVGQQFGRSGHWIG